MAAGLPASLRGGGGAEVGEVLPPWAEEGEVLPPWVEEKEVPLPCRRCRRLPRGEAEREEKTRHTPRPWPHARLLPVPHSPATGVLVAQEVAVEGVAVVVAAAAASELRPGVWDQASGRAEAALLRDRNAAEAEGGLGLDVGRPRSLQPPTLASATSTAVVGAVDAAVVVVKVLLSSGSSPEYTRLRSRSPSSTDPSIELGGK